MRLRMSTTSVRHPELWNLVQLASSASFAFPLCSSINPSLPDLSAGLSFTGTACSIHLSQMSR